MVRCAKCSKGINSKEDLVVASSWLLVPKPYHRECYSDILLKGAHPPLFSNAINVSWLRVAAGLGLFGILFAAWLYIVYVRGVISNPLIQLIGAAIFLFVFVLTLAERVYSHFMFESKLP